MQILHPARGRKRRHDRTTPRDDVPRLRGGAAGRRHCTRRKL